MPSKGKSMVPISSNTSACRQMSRGLCEAVVCGHALSRRGEGKLYTWARAVRAAGWCRRRGRGGMQSGGGAPCILPSYFPHLLLRRYLAVFVTVPAGGGQGAKPQRGCCWGRGAGGCGMPRACQSMRALAFASMPSCENLCWWGDGHCIRLKRCVCRAGTALGALRAGGMARRRQRHLHMHLASITGLGSTNALDGCTISILIPCTSSYSPCTLAQRHTLVCHCSAGHWVCCRWVADG